MRCITRPERWQDWHVHARGGCDGLPGSFMGAWLLDATEDLTSSGYPFGDLNPIASLPKVNIVERAAQCIFDGWKWVGRVIFPPIYLI